MIRLWYKGRKNPAYKQRWTERYAWYHDKKPYKGILLHSVSVGETLAAIPLIRYIQHRNPEIPITVTTMTPTGSERVKAAFGQEVNHLYFPYDLPDVIKRFLRKTQPSLVIIMETELWPNFINQLQHQHIPLVIANARLSERSARRYMKIKPIMKKLLSQIDLIAAQSSEDGKRFRTLGLQHKKLSIIGSIKFDISVNPELAMRAAALRRQWAPHRFVWIAASTHAGEEEIILHTHRQLLQSFNDLLLILVPRHPERFNSVQSLCNKMGFQSVSRSQNIIPSPSTQVMLGDTMGELMLLYGIADLAFIGGSLVEHGGHNPLEAAAHSIPIIVGPYTFNFKEVCAKLTQDNALITVNNGSSLEQAIYQLLSNEDYRTYCGQQAIEVLHKNRGALQRLQVLLEPYLPPKLH